MTRDERKSIQAVLLIMENVMDCERRGRIRQYEVQSEEDVARERPFPLLCLKACLINSA
jgi:hypothetical protein